METFSSREYVYAINEIVDNNRDDILECLFNYIESSNMEEIIGSINFTTAIKKKNVEVIKLLIDKVTDESVQAELREVLLSAGLIE